MVKKIVVPVVIVFVLIAAAFALNPSPEKHREEIRKAIAERNQLAGLLGIGALTAFASSYHQLGVASYTTVADRTASIGVFGMVFVRDQAE